MKKERTVIHLEIGNRHYYYGSIAGLFSHHSTDEIGFTYGSLRNYGLSESKPYISEKCTIRKGKLKSKENWAQGGISVDAI